MSIRDKADAALLQALDRLAPGETAEVLVYPVRGLDGLVAYLASRQTTGDLRFTMLDLAGCVALRAASEVIEQVADREDVRLVTANPGFTTRGAQIPKGTP